MYILVRKVYIFEPNRYKSVPFEKVLHKWQLLYLYFWECDISAPTGKKAAGILALQVPIYITILLLTYALTYIKIAKVSTFFFFTFTWTK